MNNIDSVLEALEQYADTSAGDAAVKARALMQVIGHGNFVLGIKMELNVLDLIENLNRAVQSRQLSASSITISMKATTASYIFFAVTLYSSVSIMKQFFLVSDEHHLVLADRLLVMCQHLLLISIEYIVLNS